LYNLKQKPLGIFRVTQPQAAFHLVPNLTSLVAGALCQFDFFWEKNYIAPLQSIDFKNHFKKSCFYCALFNHILSNALHFEKKI